MVQNRTRTEQLEKKEQERKHLAEGSRSRTERNDFKRFGTCPALKVSSVSILHIQHSLNLFLLKKASANGKT